MSSEPRIFFVIFVLFFNAGSKACFRTNQHETLSITSGNSIYKECQCEEEGYTTKNLQWLNKDNVPIELLRPGTTANMYTDEQETSLDLHVPNFTKTMSGTFKCVTQVNGITYTQSYEIIAYEPLYFYDTPNNQHLINGRTSWITCHPMSDSTLLVKWQKENEKENPLDIYDDEKYSVDRENHRLVIRNATENDAGTYKCTARVFATNEEVDEYIEVEVMTEPEIIRIIANPDNNNPTTVVTGMNLTIECVADGMPHPEYYWNKTLKEGAPESDVSWRQEINTIIFDEIRPEDSGVYTCYAYNLAGTAMMSIFVEVLVPPYITNFPNITAIEDSTVEIICNGTGKPEPTISITYEGRDFNYISNETLQQDFEPMPNMQKIDVNRLKQGVYLCNATNQVDSVQSAMYLTVLHRPYFEKHEETIWGWEGKTVNLSCEHESNPPATVSWRFAGKSLLADEEIEQNQKLLSVLRNVSEPYLALTIDNEVKYGYYYCTAKNLYGEVIKRITLQRGYTPSLLKNITSEEPTATSITFHMEAPDHVDGPDVIGFTATYDEEKNYSITDIHLNRTWAIGRPFKLDKLKPNTTYLVRFAALNEVGPGTWSEYITFSTMDKSVPEPPVLADEPVALERNVPVLKWRPSDDNGEPIEYYTLRYCSEGDEETCEVKQISSDTTTLDLEDLKPNITYYLELVAHNAEGDSLAANFSITVPDSRLQLEPTTQLSGGAIIGISIVIVLVCFLLLDVLLLVWRRQGIIATCCCYKKDTKRKESPVNSRDKKGLLATGEVEERGSVRNNGHKEFEYNKNTGVVIGKHSAV